MRSSGQTSNRTLSSHNAGALLGARITESRYPSSGSSQMYSKGTLSRSDAVSALGLHGQVRGHFA